MGEKEKERIKKLQVHMKLNIICRRWAPNTAHDTVYYKKMRIGGIKLGHRCRLFLLPASR